MRTFRIVMSLFVLAGAGAAFWYLNLDEDHKRAALSLLQQVRYLPARYQV
jgi:hypothetical protein